MMMMMIYKTMPNHLWRRKELLTELMTIVSMITVVDGQHSRLSICSFLEFDKYHQKQIHHQSDDEASWLV